MSGKYWITVIGSQVNKGHDEGGKKELGYAGLGKVFVAVWLETWRAGRRWRFLSAKRLEAGRHREAGQRSERLRQRTAGFLTDAATDTDGHTRLLSTILDPSTCFSRDDAILTPSAIRPSTSQQHERGCNICIPVALICRHALGACLCLHRSYCP